MLHVTEQLIIPDSALEVRVARSGGPGGQHVNKVETKVELRLHLRGCEALSPAVKQRLREGYPGYMTKQDEVIVVSDRYRSQARNRQDAEARLAAMIRSVLAPPKRRRPTRPSRAARERRLQAKRRTGGLKQQRRRPLPDEH